jgi:uncharacterized protein
VTLTDVGPIVAIIDADEPGHAACMEAVEHVELPLVTTWPAFTEAMSCLERAGGVSGQRALWRLVQTGRLVVANLSAAAAHRTATLMGQHDGLTLADATIVAVAEQDGHRAIFTLNDDLRALLNGPSTNGAGRGRARQGTPG